MTTFKLTKSALPTLLKVLAIARERLASHQEEFRVEENRIGRQLENEIQRLQAALERCRIAEEMAKQEIDRLSRMEVPKIGFLGRLFDMKEQPQAARDEIVKHRFKIRETEETAAPLRHQLSKLTGIQSAIARQSSWVVKLESEVERRQRKKDKMVELRAAAATNSKQTRIIAISVKTQMGKQPNCPYCNGPLGDTPHADHIYPVAKGGRSVPRNMVWVCADCNMKKRDMTLSGFIRKSPFERAVIEARLDILGKDY